ncbi:hypothetical protein BLNAU_18525 [Blattamonas nauphoetae]|uniref:Uncharacterized protein n=1 Tax=Blattamonas nauphoetae TaxID=2049346 RepID=A0ABQ9X455_9EUKA|nr:hypothetical protein BLNAU_18525 [Blattamonas nauphoetae]
MQRQASVRDLETTVFSTIEQFNSQQLLPIILDTLDDKLLHDSESNIVLTDSESHSDVQTIDPALLPQLHPLVPRYGGCHVVYRPCAENCMIMYPKDLFSSQSTIPNEPSRQQSQQEILMPGKGNSNSKNIPLSELVELLPRYENGSLHPLTVIYTPFKQSSQPFPCRQVIENIDDIIESIIQLHEVQNEITQTFSPSSMENEYAEQTADNTGANWKMLEKEIVDRLMSSIRAHPLIRRLLPDSIRIVESVEETETWIKKCSLATIALLPPEVRYLVLALPETRMVEYTACDEQSYGIMRKRILVPSRGERWNPSNENHNQFVLLNVIDMFGLNPRMLSADIEETMIQLAKDLTPTETDIRKGRECESSLLISPQYNKPVSVLGEALYVQQRLDKINETLRNNVIIEDDRHNEVRTPQQRILNSMCSRTQEVLVYPAKGSMTKFDELNWTFAFSYQCYNRRYAIRHNDFWLDHLLVDVYQRDGHKLKGQDPTGIDAFVWTKDESGVDVLVGFQVSSGEWEEVDMDHYNTIFTNLRSFLRRQYKRSKSPNSDGSWTPQVKRWFMFIVPAECQERCTHRTDVELDFVGVIDTLDFAIQSLYPNPEERQRVKEIIRRAAKMEEDEKRREFERVHRERDEESGMLIGDEERTHLDDEAESLERDEVSGILVDEAETTRLDEENVIVETKKTTRVIEKQKRIRPSSEGEEERKGKSEKTRKLN